MRPLLIRAAVVVFGLSIAGYGLYSMYARGRAMTDKGMRESEEERLHRQQKEEIAILEEPGATDTEIGAALLRLSREEVPAALDFALRKAENASPELKPIVAEALGNFSDPKAMTLLEKLTQNSIAAIRLHAIKGLARKPGEQRKALLDRIAASPASSTEERIEALGGLYRMALTPEAKRATLEKLVSLVQKNQGSEATGAILRTVSLAPMETQVLAMLRALIQTQKPSGVLKTAVEHLARLKDPWLLTNLPALQKNENLQIRLGLIGSLAMICPGSRWAFLENVILRDPRSEARIAAIDALAGMPSPQARELLNKALQSRHLSALELDYAKKRFTSLLKDTHPDPCGRTSP